MGYLLYVAPHITLIWSVILLFVGFIVATLIEKKASKLLWVVTSLLIVFVLIVGGIWSKRILKKVTGDGWIKGIK